MNSSTLDTGVNALPTAVCASIQELDERYIMPTYGRQPMVFVRGSGATLWDSDGKEYLDCLAGIAVASVGHCHPAVAAAIADQAARLMHVSNLFHNEHQARLAERLCSHAGMERAFFCNSGAEANEAAIKIARKWGKTRRSGPAHEIITFRGSFHGRTLGALAATAQEKYQAPFEPLMAGFRYAEFNNLASVQSLIGSATCAILVEPIQGESGIHVADDAFLFGLRDLCDQHNLLLIFDEVQCGMGRTGAFLASQLAGVPGDVIALAKGIAGGFPMGVCLARGEAAVTLQRGDHGSTFGGQPLACAAALATLDVLEHEGLVQHAREMGDYLSGLFSDAMEAMPGVISAVRGRGLMIAVDLASASAPSIYQEMLARGIIVNATGPQTIRIVPPLVITKAECSRLVDVFTSVLADAHH